MTGLSSSVRVTNPDRNIVTHTLAFGGNLKVKTFLDYLYQDTSETKLYLERKYSLFQEGKKNIADTYKLDKFAEDIIRMHQDGRMLNDISSVYNVCPKTIENLIHRFTGKYLPNKKPCINDFRDRAIEMALAGNTYKAIAEELGFSLWVIWDYLKKQNISRIKAAPAAA